MSDLFTPDSVNALLRRIQKAAEDAVEGQRDGLMQAGRVVLTASNRQVPHEDGDTERSGSVTVNPAGNVCAISYKDQAYRGQAADLHEDMNMKHDEGRNAKFLENALRKTADQQREIIGREVKSRMGT